MAEEKKEGYSIDCFTVGDLIIRCCPAKIKSTRYNENLGIEINVTEREDYSFRETPVKLLAIENGIIYVQRLEKVLNYDKDKRCISKLLTEHYYFGTIKG